MAELTGPCTAATPCSSYGQQHDSAYHRSWMDLRRLRCEPVVSAQCQSKRPVECADDDQEAHHSCRKRELIQEVADEEEHDTHEEQQAVPAIFLSHSGKQKPFVEHLDNALRHTNHTPFFDQFTLLKGSRFPPQIERAARGCKLGVVVLSDDFVTTKWPMRELEILLSKPDPQVLPLFYKLSPGDLKRPEKLSEWRKEWQKLAARYENVEIELWEKVLRDLDSFNGEVYCAGTSEADYIERVVRRICDRVPSPAPHDLSQIRGHERLAKEVARLFDHACMVGLHGVGGLGKTTMCKIMVNFYNSEYPGRACLIEFPSDGNQNNIVEECKRFLKQLLNLSEEHLLNKIHTFDQVVQLMRDHLRKYDVFIAMDNIWSSSLEEAKKFLQEFKNFGSCSKILLTSRSKRVIQDLLERHSNTCVESLPNLEHAEAVQIFEDSVERDDVKPLMSSVFKQCVFDETFHPLALKAVGLYVKRVWELEGKKDLELVMKERIQSLEDAIRINYECLSDVKKHIFLDIAYLLPCLIDLFWELTYVEARKWLSLLYKDSKSKSDISNIIYELALDGLIDIVEPDGAKQIQIRVHDLYAELAEREVAKSLRFFVGGISSFKMEEIQWKKLERVILNEVSDYDEMFIDKLELQECPNLQVLYASGHEKVFAQGIHLDRMPSLCILKLSGFVKVRSIEKWGAAAASLAVIDLDRVKVEQILERIPNLPCLEKLSIMYCQIHLEGPPYLHGCTQLKELFLVNYSNSLQIDGLTGIERFPNLSALVQLNILRIHKFYSLERIEGLDSLKSLQDLSLMSLRSLKSLHGLSALVQLKSLEIYDCFGLQELTGLDALKSLQELQLQSLRSLKRLHGLSGLVQLESLYITDCSVLEEFTGLHALKSLQMLCLWDLWSLRSLHGLSGLVQLESLEISSCSGLEELKGLDALKSLQKLSLMSLRSLKSLHGLSGLVHLESLEISSCSGLEELAGLNALESLQKLCLMSLRGLKHLHGLSGLVRLESLYINDCSGLEELTGLDSLKSLQKLCLMSLRSLKILSGLSGLVQLESLEISSCFGLDELTGLDALKSLQKLDLKSLSSLKSLHGLSGLIQLERLEISSCSGLEELTGLACRRLRTLAVNSCKALKKVADFSALTSLQSLRLFHNELLEEIGGHLSSTQLEILSIKCCTRLRKLPCFKDCPHIRELHLTTLTDWNHLTSISVLKLIKLKAVKFLITPPLTSLKCLSLKHCKNLEKVSDLGFLTSLIRLGVYNCEALEEIGDLSALESLKQIKLERCGSLKKLVGLLTSTKLQFSDCPFLETQYKDCDFGRCEGEDYISSGCEGEDYSSKYPSTKIHNHKASTFHFE